MKTSKSRWHFVALMGACTLWAPATAHAAGFANYWTVAAGAVAQTTRSEAATNRAEAEKLLERARAALKQGDFDTAESLLTTAEKLNAHFGVFHLGDTPRKLRADLTAAQRRGTKATKRPSQKITPELPVADVRDQPTTGQQTTRVPTEVTDPRQEAPLKLPQAGGRVKPLLAPLTAAATPANESPSATRLPAPSAVQTAAAGDQDARRRSDFHLLSARRALAVGDVRQALAEVNEARHLGVEYDFHEDSPEKVDAAITKYQHVTEAIDGRQDEASRRQLADLLMDQAQQLLRWRQYDEADRLVRHAQGLGVNYGPFDVQPEALAERIAAARGQGTGPQGAAPARPLPSQGAAKSYPGARAVYESTADATGNRVASAQEELPPEDLAPTASDSTAAAQPVPGSASEALQLYGLGEQALRNRDTQRAVEYFRRAFQLRDQLDPTTAQRLQDHLQLLSAPPAARGTKPELLLDNEASQQTLLARKCRTTWPRKK